jgi:hypothetical protein
MTDTSHATHHATHAVDVTVWWGSTVIANHRVAAGNAFTVGDSDRATFRLAHPAIPSKLHALVEATDNGARLHPHGNMLVRGDTIVGVGDVSRITLGPVVFVVQHRARATVTRPKLADVIDFFYSKVLAVALLLQFGVVTAIALTPHFPSAIDENLGKGVATWRDVKISTHSKKQETSEPATLLQHQNNNHRQTALDALAALGLQGPAGAVSDASGPGGAGASVGLSGLRGASLVDVASGAMTRPTGAGTGGSAPLGIVGLSNERRNPVDTSLGHRKDVARISAKDVIHDDGLSRDEIQRVIARAMAQMKYCYEKELDRDPALEGKLVLHWLIQTTGEVAAVNVDDAMSGVVSGVAPVAECVSRVLQRMKFPNPRGGGVVHVSYPLVFRKGAPGGKDLRTAASDL